MASLRSSFSRMVTVGWLLGAGQAPRSDHNAHLQAASPPRYLCPAVGKVYHGWFEVGESIKAETVTYIQEAGEKHESRWEYAHCAFFAAGYVCDPEFIEHDQSSQSEVQEGLMETMERIAILLKVRNLAGKDDTLTKQWAARRQAINADATAQGTWDNFPSYPDEKDRDVMEFCKLVTAQLTMYRAKKGIFARSWVIDAARDMPAYLWWDQHGSSVPEFLQASARLVLAQPASASICERINSEFEFVKDQRQNRLGHENANKLVALFHNLRLLKRMRELKYVEPTIAWSDDLERSAVTKYEPGKASSDRSKLLNATAVVTSPHASSSAIVPSASSEL